MPPVPDTSQSAASPVFTDSDASEIDSFEWVEAETTVDDFVWIAEPPSPRPLEFCAPESLTPAQREQLGERFRADVLDDIREDCERTSSADRHAAVKRLTGRARTAGQAEALLDRMVAMLQRSRLTINFKAEQLVQSDGWFKQDEYLNCFARGEGPGQPVGYSVGRAQMEESALGLSRTLNSSTCREYGRFESVADATRRQRWFQPGSRPLYAALDFLDGPRGGAQHYGGSYLVLEEHMKRMASFTPTDSFATRHLRNAVSPEKVCTWHHFPRLVRHAQNDLVGYNCLKHLCRAADGQVGPVPSGYGKGGANNYIEAQVYGRIRFECDVKEIHISLAELNDLPTQKRDRLIATLAAANARMGRRFYIVD